MSITLKVSVLILIKLSISNPEISFTLIYVVTPVVD